MATGFFKVHRELFDKPIFLNSTPEQVKVLLVVLSSAQHRGNQWEWNGEQYDLEPGQFVTSLESLRSKCGKGVSIQNIRTALKRFEKLGFLTSKATNQNRLITVVNWSAYQREAREPTSGPTGDQQATNKRLTSNQQATNKQLTTIERMKEGEKDKKEEKDKKKAYVPSASPSEPSATKTAEPAEPVLVEIPLCEKAADGNPRLFQVVESLAAQWQEDFPGVDVLAELRKARAWSDANPSRRKTPRGIKSHLASWLSRAQDKGGRRVGASGNGNAEFDPKSNLVRLPNGQSISRQGYRTAQSIANVLSEMEEE